MCTLLGGDVVFKCRPVHASHDDSSIAAAAPATSAPGPTGFPAGVPSLAASPVACQPGVDTVVSVPDASAPDRLRRVWVHRPPGPDRATVPVVYALHGYPADPSDLATGALARLLDAQMCRTGQPFVLAVPDGRVDDLDTEWGDDVTGRFAIETFVTVTAVALVEGAQRRPPGERALIGFSMGGYGAAALALRHPDEYRQVAAFAGYFHVDDPDSVFGADTAPHAPDQLVGTGAATGQRYFLVEGTDEDTALQLGSIRGEAERFAGLLRTAGVTARVYHPEGGHTEDAWYAELGPMVDFLDVGWRADS